MFKIHGIGRICEQPVFKTMQNNNQYCTFKISQKRTNSNNTTIEDKFTLIIMNQYCLSQVGNMLNVGNLIYFEGDAETYVSQQGYFNPSFKLTAVRILQQPNAKPKASQVQVQQQVNNAQPQQKINPAGYQQPYPQSAFSKNNALNQEQNQQQNNQNNAGVDIDIPDDQLPF